MKKKLHFYYYIFLFFLLCLENGMAGIPINKLFNSQSLKSYKSLAVYEQISINLYYLNTDNSVDLVDGVLAQYDPSFSNGVDILDGIKFPNINESFALQRNSKLLTIERRQIIGVSDTLFFNLKNTTVRDYQFQFVPSNLAHPCLSAFLEDNFLLTSTPIDLNSINTVNFSVTSAVASKAADRFRLVFKTGIIWTGAVNSDWFTSGNWSGNVLPSATCGDVIIPNTTNKPVISSGVAIVRNLNIQPGATLTVNNATLQIGAVITNAGSLNTDNGTIEMNGSLAQVIPLSAFVNNTLNALVINNPVSVTMGGALIIKDSLSLKKGIFKLNDNYITLHSDVANTARVAALGINASIDYSTTGNFVIERYYPARRAWRLITAPVSTNRSIFSSWQIGGGNTTDAIKPAIPESGTYITSPSPGPGLDKSINYSLDSFNTTTGKLVHINDTKNTKLGDSTGITPDNKSYFIFIRGDRTPNNLMPPVTNITTLRDTGKIQIGTKNFALASTGNFSLIGNPYAAPVDFESLPKTKIADKFWAWDPRLNSTLGGYALVSKVGSSYTTTPKCTPCGVSLQTKHIQSGQAVFVQTINAGSLTFTENNKSASVNQSVFRFENSIAALPWLRANLLLSEPDTFILADGVLLQFDKSFSDDIDDQDAVKFTNILENFGIIKDNKTLMIEASSQLNPEDTIFFKLWNTTKRAYQLEFEAANLSSTGLQPFLQDNYFHSSIPLKWEGTTFVDFSVTDDSASAAINRFSIVFKPSVSLPVTISNVKAYNQNHNTIVEWTVDNEINIKQYEVERSTDGLNFKKQVVLMAAQNNLSIANYEWQDVHAVTGTFYYKIRSVSQSGEINYSKVVKVTIDRHEPEIAIYPNPIVNGTIHLHLLDQPVGTYVIKLINKLGQIILVKEVRHTYRSSTEIFQLNKALADGTYQLHITRPDLIKIVIDIIK